ncbi:ParA family protein [Deinococcus sp. S9]|uniref:ParA family protein n=1 Tax=Deinococcus sp. S9 TaxID=2545754 RepID=UPI001054705C|nr:ParA family protein [Deinococcus sp. S9]TDE84730.1 ParA family protein [Deinococcus sp. S9]
MNVISVASEKGGVGKSTSAVTLAAHFAGRGRTLLVDADERLRSAWNWTTKKEDYAGWGFDVLLYSDFVAQAEPGQGYEFVVLDTKGGEGASELVALARNSSLLIIPTKPDGVSADGLVATLQPLLEQNVTNYRVLLTDVPPAPNSDGLDMRLELDTAGIPLFGHSIRHAVAVSKAAREGICVRDVKADRYAKLVWMDYELISREVLNYVK